jgi:uncharacterized membrane protein (UPF0127 family)
MRRPLALSLSALAIVLASLSISCAEGEALPVLTLRSGDVSLEAELAATPETMERGLMFRDSLPDGKGMLFAYPSDRRMSFWMKNTKVALSIAFLSADGRILEIRDMESESLEAIHSSRSARFALEAPKGWFDRVGLAPGDRFDIPPID